MRVEWVASSLALYLRTWCIQHYYRWYAHLGCRSRLNWRHTARFKWTGPFGWKTKSGFCACAVTFQLGTYQGFIDHTLIILGTIWKYERLFYRAVYLRYNYLPIYCPTWLGYFFYSKYSRFTVAKIWQNFFFNFGTVQESCIFKKNNYFCTKTHFKTFTY